MKALLEIDQLSYNINQKKILNSISLKVFPREFCIIEGENGSGKSTLLRIIKNHKNFPKTIRLNLKDKEIVSLDQNIEKSLFAELSVLENYMLFTNARALNKKRNRKIALSFFKKEALQFYNKLDTKVSELSGGEKQNLALNLHLQRPCKILLLDEHTSSLDPRAEKMIMSKIIRSFEKNNFSVLMVSHSPYHKKYATKVIKINNGAIQEGLIKP